jgi:hypothetical protein
VPSTVTDVFAAAGLSPAGVQPWRTPPAPPAAGTAPATGIYVVALTDQLDTRAGALAEAPISESAIDELLAVRPELTLDRARPTREQLIERLAAFWFPDEVVVYIGLAGPRKNRPAQGELAKRVGEYYDTPLGASGPHAGGWPLKTLACLDELYVHYAYCDRVSEAEHNSIECFANGASERARAGLRDPVRVMPFANLEFPKGNPKDHGIQGARAPKLKRAARRAVKAVARTAAPTSPTSSRSAAQAKPTRVAATGTPLHRSQKMTLGDIAVGQVRIPIGATKTILPPARRDVMVIVRGRELTARWDPRYGEKERSGVIRVGKAAAAELLSPGDVLAVSVAPDGSVSLD